MKSVFAGDSETAKFNARATLVFVLDSALRLLSPFMPFITEELYQRLPIYEPAPSICVAPYPETVRSFYIPSFWATYTIHFLVLTECLYGGLTQESYQKWRNETLEQEVQFVQKIVHALRSAQTDYNLPKVKVSAYRERQENEKPKAEGKI